MDNIILFRIGERLTLTAVVLVIAIVVMVGFWRSVQKLDVEYTGKLGGSFVFTTPVFVLLAIIGYSWVSLEHPIEVGPAGAGAAPGQSSDPAKVAASSVAGKFVGSAPIPDPTASDPDYDLIQAELKVRSLNCLAEGKSLSPQVEDDLAAAKLMLLAPVWPAEWGDFVAFSDWAMGRSAAAPDADARAAYERLHVAC